MIGQPTEVGLALGSNVGDKAAHIARALAALAAAGLAGDLEVSALYRTPPWGPVAQDWYVNCCAVGITAVPPRELLARVKALEVALGRIETVRWGPRVIDIDILYYGDEIVDTPALTLPHPEMLKRGFVLIPLAELRPERRFGSTTIADAAARCDAEGIERLG